VTPTRQSPSRKVVIGVGNPYRGDDGVGPEVAARLRVSEPVGVEVLDYDGDPAGLLDLWDGADLAVVVDALPSHHRCPGRIHRIEVDGETDLNVGPAVSSHGVGPGHAVELARVLGRMPRRLVLYGVEGNRFSHGMKLSPEVEASVAAVVERISAEVVR
jgi:hydrogenase maturation protease